MKKYIQVVVVFGVTFVSLTTHRVLYVQLAVYYLRLHGQDVCKEGGNRQLQAVKGLPPYHA